MLLCYLVKVEYDDWNIFTNKTYTVRSLLSCIVIFNCIGLMLNQRIGFVFREIAE